MKLIVNLKSIQNIAQYDADGLIFSHAFLTDEDEALYTIEEIQEIVTFAKKQGKLTILNMNRLFHEYELEELKTYIQFFLTLEIDYYICSDLAVLYIFMELGKLNQLIYHARTMITATEEANYWKNKGLHSVFVSNELTLEDIYAIATTKSIAIEAYGHHQIFSSKRDLVSLYFTQSNNSNRKPKFTKYLMQEELRNEKYPILENHHGTVIYSAYKYAILEELDKIKDLVMYCYINSIFIPEEELLAILKIYKQVIQEKFDTKVTQQAVEKLSQIDPNIYSGFLYKKSIIKKEQEDAKN